MSFYQNFCHLDPNTSNGKTFATFGKWQNFCPFTLLHFGSKHYLNNSKIKSYLAKLMGAPAPPDSGIDSGIVPSEKPEPQELQF
jgi:hypothetical protein